MMITEINVYEKQGLDEIISISSIAQGTAAYIEEVTAAVEEQVLPAEQLTHLLVKANC